MKHMNEYTSKMDQIELPVYLKDRVLAETRELKGQVAAGSFDEKREAEVPAAAPSQRRKIHPAFALAGAAAAVFAFIAVATVGGLFGVIGNVESNQGTEWSGDPFTLVAYAAEPGVQYAKADDGVVFGAQGMGMMSRDYGMYTGCLFSIEGAGITQVDISLSRGQIYGYAEQEYVRLLPYAGEPEERTDAYEKIDQKLGGPHEQNSEGGRSADMKTFTASGCRLLGKECSLSTVAFEGGLDLHEVKFGFWVSPEDVAPEEVSDRDLKQAWYQSLDSLDGQTLRVAVHYADGSQAEQTYVLKTGKMKIEYANDSSITVIPEQASDDEPYIYAVYGTIVS